MTTMNCKGGMELAYREEFSLADIPEEGKKMLLEYSGLDEEDLLPHILRIRDKAFQSSPFPCVGNVRFLGDRWKNAPYAGEVISQLKSGATLLDIGCGLGQEIRYLTFWYGIDSSQLVGLDLDSNLIEQGYELFRDRDKLKATFVTADLMDIASSPQLEKFRGSFDLVNASQLFHVWDWDEMLEAAKIFVSLTRERGSLIVGNQVGSIKPDSYHIPGSWSNTKSHYRHDEESWKRFWEQVGKETDTTWEASYHTYDSPAVRESRSASWAKSDPGMTMFWFTVRRI